MIAQMVKNLPAVWKTWLWPLHWEGPLEKELATHSSILAWRIPWTEEPGRPLWSDHKGSDVTECLMWWWYKRYHDTCPSFSIRLLHIVWSSLGLSMLQQMARFHSFFMLSHNSIVYGYHIFHLLLKLLLCLSYYEECCHEHCGVCIFLN